MAKQSTNDTAIRPLEKVISNMCQRTGYTPDSVFEGLLDYIIGYLNPTPEPVEGWKFKPGDTASFHEMMKILFDIYLHEIPKRGWYDPFGDLYMAIHAGGGGKGQFFTPASVAEVTARVTVGGWSSQEGSHTPFGKRMVINDCAAGSGRMPLAGYVAMLDVMQKEWGWDATQTEARRPYLSCEDLDFNCVKMSAINMAFHGCFGEAVCHDSICDSDKVRLGYIVNETMWPFPTNVPSIRKESNPMKFVCTRMWAMRGSADRKTIDNEPEQSQESGVSDFTPETPLSDPVQPKANKQPVQLELW